jgi:uncharacterized membrane protein YbhN (UPF0104 family)
VILARLAVAAGLLVWLAYEIPLHEVYLALSAARLPALGGALLLAFAMHLLAAVRVRRLLQPARRRWTTLGLFQINLATQFYGLFLPAGNVTGILVRYYGLAREHEADAGVAVCLVFDRVVVTATLCLVGIACWLVAAPRATWPVAAAMMAVLGAFGLLQWIVLGRRSSIRGLRRRTARLVPARLQTLIEVVWRALRLPRSVLVKVLSLSLLGHLLGILAYALVAAALGLELGLLDLGWIRTAAALITILPVSVAGLGVREGALVLLLAPLGIEPAQALVFSLLVFAVTMLLFGLAGGLVEARRLLLQKPADPDAPPDRLI